MSSKPESGSERYIHDLELRVADLAARNDELKQKSSELASGKATLHRQNAAVTAELSEVMSDRKETNSLKPAQSTESYALRAMNVKKVLLDVACRLGALEDEVLQLRSEWKEGQEAAKASDRKGVDQLMSQLQAMDATREKEMIEVREGHQNVLNAISSAVEDLPSLATGPPHSYNGRNNATYNQQCLQCEILAQKIDHLEHSKAKLLEALKAG